MSLLAFEAAARGGSFLHAARTLNVTPGAVSRQIQGLESFLGARLFVRHHRRVELTPLGRSYLGEIAVPLDRIGAATARIRGDSRRGAIAVLAYPTFAIRWLIPRWGRFYDRHPSIDVRLTTSLGPVDFVRGDHDLAVQVVREGDSPAGLAVHELIGVAVFPVCSPPVAARLRAPADLGAETLLHGTPRPRDWLHWIEAAGAVALDPDRGIRFESLNLAFQAAIEGLGVAMGIEALVADDLAAGRLVRPFAAAWRSHRPFCVVYPAARAEEPTLALFRDWLLEEATGGGGSRRGEAPPR
jgi:LysR family glycine cleavage system transcriptional activator